MPNTPEYKQVCSNCAYYRVTEQITQGFCHAKPPKPEIIAQHGQPIQMSLRPIVMMNDLGCSLFVPRAQHLIVAED